MREALQHYREKNSDFGDALLCSYAQGAGFEVATFDRGIPKKFPEVVAYAPAGKVGGKPTGKFKRD